MNENLEQAIELTKAQIREIELKLENKKIFPRIETIENVLNLIPRRLNKNPTNYSQRKNDLEKITQEEDTSEEKLNKMPSFNIQEYQFKGEDNINEVFLQQANLLDQSFQEEKEFEFVNTKPILNDVKVISGRQIPEILEIKNIENLPNELRTIYQIPEFKPDQQQKEQEQDNKLEMYIHPRYQQDNDLLYKLMKQSSLRKFQLFCLNNFYILCDTKPTTRDIEDRAMLLAKLYIKYHLKDEQMKIQQELEEQLNNYKEKLQKLIQKQQIKLELEGKIQIQNNEESEKSDSSPDKKSPTQKSNQNNNPEPNSQEIANNNEQNNLNSLQQQSDSQLTQQQIQEYVVQQIKIQKQRAYIEKYYGQIVQFLEQNAYQCYKAGNYMKSIEFKKEKEALQQEYENQTNLETLLRYLLSYKFQHKI